MIKEEKILRNKFGSENHFTVPDGYFDNFAEQLERQLPEQEPRVVTVSLWSRLPLRKVAAAVGAVACLALGALYVVQRTAHNAPKVAHAEAPKHTEETSGTTDYASYDAMLDYTMTDNQEIYASLLAEN